MSQNFGSKYVKKIKSNVIYDLVSHKCDVDLVVLHYYICSQTINHNKHPYQQVY